MRGTILSLITLLILLISPCFAADLPLPTLNAKPSISNFDHSHSKWSAVLREQVVIRGPQSRVRYDRVKADRQPLKDYIDIIDSVSESEYARFTEPQKIAFLLNAYNAYTLTLIVDNYPVPSIKNIGGWFKSPWKIEFVTLHGKVHSLDDIEHTMLRQEFNEPRIHFALVCAAVSCPALRNEAYVAERLDAQLDDAAERFLSDPERNRFDT